MVNQFSRNELAFGKEGVEQLKNASVAVLGIGGVGSFAAEALCRSGIGRSNSCTASYDWVAKSRSDGKAFERNQSEY